MRIPTILFLATACWPLLSQAQVAPAIETLMSQDERRKTGIDSLSVEQRRALNAWIQRYLEGDVEDPAPGDIPVLAEPEAELRETAPPAAAVASAPAVAEVEDDFRRPRERVEIHSRIAGGFSGWTGRTRFTLENGQVWEQRRGRRWKIELDSPEVRIYQNFMGAYEMEVISEARSIGVRRIR